MLLNSNWDLFIKSMIAIVVIAALSAAVKIMVPKIKGKSGEVSIALLLKKLGTEDYIVLNNIMLNTSGADGANINTSQIDHVIVSRYGLFSIETKNYKGWITGTENGAKWTQTIYKTKNQFMNPIRQNYGHVKALEALIRENSGKCGLMENTDVPIYPIVTFSGESTLKVKIDKADVVYWGQLVTTIKKYSTEKILTEDQMALIADLLREHNIDSRENRKEHVQNIREEKTRKTESVASGICPKCGSSLVERSGKYGRFYGCSNFPDCKYTQKI